MPSNLFPFCTYAQLPSGDSLGNAMEIRLNHMPTSQQNDHACRKQTTGYQTTPGGLPERKTHHAPATDLRHRRASGELFQPGAMGKMNVILIGESIHGVAEFTEFKHRWLREEAPSPPVVVFEADHVGMLLSAHEKSQATHILRNFPKVHRTEEMRLLIQHILQENIPFYGADLVTRNKSATCSGNFQSLRDRQIAAEMQVYSGSPPLYQLRDEYMGDVVAHAATAHPDRTVVGFFHNMHIKHNGSLEQNHLRLTSIAENLRLKHNIPARSIGLFASGGTAVCNDLSPLAFDIGDEDVIEHLARKTQQVTRIACSQLANHLTAYHHAFEKENIPVNRQYDECVIFPTARPPTLLSDCT